MSTASERKDEILKVFAKLSKAKGRYPNKTEMLKEDVPRHDIRHYFGDMDSLCEASRKAYPKFFDDVVDPDHFNQDAFDALKDHVKKYKKFFISCVVPGGKVGDDEMEAVKTWCKIEKGTSLFLAANYGLFELPADFVSENNIVFRDLKLNSNVWLSTIKIDPKQKDPAVSLETIGQNEGTMIIASPKQRHKGVANSNTKLPHIIQGTGAITKPNYVTKVAFGRSSERRDYLAKRQHVMGGIIVELVDDKIYHMRRVQFDKDGSFNDLFYRYDDEGKKFVGCEAVVQGDFHDGETDPKADHVADELCRIGKPKYRVFHDVFNGDSISHHDRKKKVTQSIKAGQNRLSLATELHNLKLTMAKKIKASGAEKFIWVASNHDEFLHRYLEEGDFDDQNRLISAKLWVGMIEGKDPLQYAMELMGLKTDKIIWLSRDQDFKITPKKIEVGAHGDLGANGSRNSGCAGMLKSYGPCSFGHVHYAEVLHDAVSVGTSSFLKLGYNRGPSSWVQAHEVIYKNGTRQLIYAINGKYKLED